MIYHTGVYCILNLVNGKRYVGSSSVMGLEKRTAAHLYYLRLDKHPNNHLQRSWNKHGEEQFVVLYLERCAPDDCLRCEQYWMGHYRSANPKVGYNQSPTAGSNLGMKFGPLSEERRQQISQQITGIKRSPETCKKIGDAHRGTKTSRIARRKQSLAKRGKTHEEIYGVVGAALRRLHMGSVMRGRSTNRKGKTYEEIYGPEKAAELREIRRLASTGRVVSEESRRKSSESQKGRVITPEHRRKISQTLLSRGGAK
jgi:group I intron endonuclease